MIYVARFCAQPGHATADDHAQQRKEAGPEKHGLVPAAKVCWLAKVNRNDDFDGFCFRRILKTTPKMFQ